MTIASEAEKTRKALKRIAKRIGDLVEEQRRLEIVLHDHESVCRHLWSKRKYVKTRDIFQRTCDRCGMVSESKD